MSGSARSAEKRVMVLPEPGGPHSTKNEIQLLIGILFNSIIILDKDYGHAGCFSRTLGEFCLMMDCEKGI